MEIVAGLKRMGLRYFGGKWRLAPWIISHFPAHNCYVEPFAGGSSVLLRKAEAKAEVLNDLDGEIVNFWKVLRERTDEFVKAVELTPFSKEETNLAYQLAEDPLERARRLYVRSWQLRGGARAQWRSGWRHCRGNGRSNSAAHDWAKTDHLWDVAARLKCVQIENDDAVTVIRRFDSPGTLFYVDPPYLAEARGKWKQKAYLHEMDEEAHRQLSEVLRSVKGAVVLSGYDSKLYQDLYAGWIRTEKRSQCDSHHGEIWRTEVLWARPAAIVIP